jgi:3-oxoacyl-[acyl-carrier-protein] synthase-3
VPVALTEALAEGRVTPGALILMPAFGAGLTLCAHLVRWGDRVTPLATIDDDLSPCTRTALEIVNDLRALKTGARERSGAGLQLPALAGGREAGWDGRRHS